MHAKTQVRNSSTHKPAENLFYSAAHLGPPSPRGPPTFRLRPPPNLSLARSLELNPNRFQGQTRSFRSGLGESRWKSPLHQVHQKLQAKLVLHKESGPCQPYNRAKLIPPGWRYRQRARQPGFSFGQVGLVNKPLNQTDDPKSKISKSRLLQRGTSKNGNEPSLHARNHTQVGARSPSLRRLGSLVSQGEPVIHQKRQTCYKSRTKKKASEKRGTSQ